MNQKRLIKRLIIILMFTIICVFILFQKMTIEIKTVGKIIPKSDFQLIQNFPNSLVIEENHYLKTQKCQRTSFNFNRGDIVNFSIAYNDNQIEKNTKIGFINSEILNYEILQLEGELKQEQASLIADSVGRKASVVEEAENELKLRQTELIERKLKFNRLTELKKSKLVSEQEYEIAKNNLDVCEIQVLVA